MVKNVENIIHKLKLVKYIKYNLKNMSQDLQNICSWTKKILGRCHDFKHKSKFWNLSGKNARRVEKKNMSQVEKNRTWV